MTDTGPCNCEQSQKLLDEVERLRDALADERAGRCADQLDLVGARALLADATARAEKAEAERDQALAACAELRAALERMIKYAVEDRATTPGSTRLERQITRANCLLARTDLGRGMVAVPREMVERAQTVVGWYVDNGRGLPHGTRIGEKLLCDLDALLDGGKVKR